MNSKDWAYLVGGAAIGGIVVYGVIKFVESQQHRTLQGSIRHIEGRVTGVEGKVLAQGENIGQIQLDVRFLRVQVPEVSQRVSRIEGYLTPPPPSDPTA